MMRLVAPSSSVLSTYIWLALVCALVKLLTPFWNDTPWFQVLVIFPAGGAAVWKLHQFLVAKVMVRPGQRDGKS